MDALFVGITKQKVNWIIDADIRGFFDDISHEWLMKFLKHRIAGPRMLRLLKKWLRAGVSEDGEWSPTTVGTPQGAVFCRRQTDDRATAASERVLALRVGPMD